MDLELNFIEPQDNKRAIKCTVHKSGKLGFSFGAFEYLKLADYKSISVATNKGVPSDENLYIILNKEESTSSYRISKAGDYYYINAKDLFEKIKVDYTDDSQTIIYDISELPQKINNKTVFKLKKRVLENKGKASKK